MKLTDEELVRVYGGATNWLSSAALNAIARLVTVVLDLGRTIGSSINRYKNKNYCS